ncbi:transketolase activity protein [[Candida] boidinii]|nr:transketolase activity protein [[Candida] boidinii]OWB59510.1 transketolase activity protein [[Candida] boidinii]OWB73759.1 transketolase activity protein [[Candida] boidinii]OWB76381.1 transketolase activity protein [[Candida] boidinii]
MMTETEISSIIQAKQDQQKHDIVLKTFRCLISDLVQNYKGGHPGGAMGMAAIGIALWKYVMKYSPTNPSYFNRDRFVLSNGHTCLFQYTFHHLVGYEHMTLNELKTYHSSEEESFCPGHPEIEHPGIEVTTGPLGQGIANAVGLAIASKNLAATYNKPDFQVVNNNIFCMVGDACLQEGVGLEAISIAGHLQLNNLIVMYDNNQITCDGSVDLTNTEDINAKFKACGWNVIEIPDANYDILSIVKAMEEAKKSDKPTLINCHTIIGIGAPVQGTAVAHGAAFGDEGVRQVKLFNGFNPDEKFVVSDEVYEFFSDIKQRGITHENNWNRLFNSYKNTYPELGEELQNRIDGKLPKIWKDLIPKQFPIQDTPSRKSGGLVLNPIAENCNSFMVGVADLSPSVNMAWNGKKDFQNPNIKTTCGINGDYSGRYIHMGIREHAMCAIANGIAAYNKNTFIPVTSTFFMFYLYAAPAVRMGSLMELKIIHVGTHDSIGTGEDGPTHQPIALAAFYRSLPNFYYFRPCDSIETAACYETAIEADGISSLISESRQNLKQYPEFSKFELVKKGGYIFQDFNKFNENYDLIIIGVGSEMVFAVESAEILRNKGYNVRVVSFPCQRLFEQQSLEYRHQVLMRDQLVPTVVIEAYASNGWERYATAGINMKTFGKSLPGKSAYKFFGYNSESISGKVDDYLQAIKSNNKIVYEFQDLN